MRRNGLRWALATGVLAAGVAMAGGGDQQAQAQPKTADHQAALAEIKDWSEPSQKAAKEMLQRYGPPDEKTASMWVWNNNGPWKRSILYKEPVQHDFPVPHQDVLEQFVDYDVPADKFDELARFDGSVIAERTKGELSARCDKEGANFLAINLADDVIKGEKSVQQARQAYGKNIQKMMQGQKTPDTSGFTFKLAQRDITNADQPLGWLVEGMKATGTGGAGEQGGEPQKAPPEQPEQPMEQP